MMNGYSVEEVDDFLDERNVIYMPQDNIVYMDSFCYEGISCEEFENNVRELSAYFDSKYENNK